MSKRRLAVLIAGLFAAPIGIASVTGLSTEERLPPETVAQPAEPTATEQAESAPTAPVEQAAPAEQPPAQEVGYVVPARPRTLADATPPSLQSDVFPPSTDDKPLLPTLAAYLDRKAANTLLADAGSREPVFAPSYEDRMLPTLIAYFDRMEAQRIAVAEARARQEQQAMTPPPSAPVVAAADQPAPPQSEANIDRVAENVRQ